MNNIAIIRNPDTLEMLGYAPIYDSGNSMFYNIPYEKLQQVRVDDIKTHSFIERERSYGRTEIINIVNRCWRKEPI